MPPVSTRLLCSLLLALPASALPLGAQGIMGRLKSRVEKQVEKIADTTVDQGVKTVAGAVRCAISDQACIDKAKQDGKPIVVTDGSGKRVSSADSARAVGAPAAAQAGGPGKAGTSAPAVALINYDFVPGDRVIFAEDFAHDPVGDLPTRVKVESGNWEVADYLGQRFLRSSSGGWFRIPLPEVLPERFTLEADVIHDGGWSTHVWFVSDEHQQRSHYEDAFFGTSGGIGKFTSAAPEFHSMKLYHIRIMADGGHVKVYEDGKRVANVPEANLGRSNAVWMRGPGGDKNPFYITNIRIAESQKKLFDVLSASGRVATHGILFDTNSDDIRPESQPTLQEIADMLTQHPDLKLTIEGHTDNVGQAAANLSLSQRRADAVKSYLVSTFHVDGSRLTTKGLGDTKPAASNDTPEGRQQNRRVELVKM